MQMRLLLAAYNVLKEAQYEGHCPDPEPDMGMDMDPNPKDPES
jgi:hypothetical protein